MPAAARVTGSSSHQRYPRSVPRLPRAPALAIVFLVYSAVWLGWFLFVINGSLLEADHGERFRRLSGWPTTLMVTGLAWTLLQFSLVFIAFRQQWRGRVVSMVVVTGATLIVTSLMPAAFGRLGYAGISTSEFMDATFMLLGGILPGGQATLGVRLAAFALLVLTVIALAPARTRQEVDQRPYN